MEIRSATMAERLTAREQGEPAEMRIRGILRGGFVHGEDFYFTGQDAWAVRASNETVYLRPAAVAAE